MKKIIFILLFALLIVPHTLYSQITWKEKVLDTAKSALAARMLISCSTIDFLETADENGWSYDLRNIRSIIPKIKVEGYKALKADLAYLPFTDYSGGDTSEGILFFGVGKKYKEDFSLIIRMIGDDSLRFSDVRNRPMGTFNSSLTCLDCDSTSTVTSIAGNGKDRYFDPLHTKYKCFSNCLKSLPNPIKKAIIAVCAACINAPSYYTCIPCIVGSGLAAAYCWWPTGCFKH